tara:strand:- start:32 stop:940 length:909 start_codon:yes stop_codon:yes gene_type:complete
MVKKIKFIIQEQKRIDVLIAEHLPELSRSQARKLIDNGNVLINNQKVKASLIPQISSEVKITLPLIEDFDELASKINIEILYEDESMVALNKPAGLLVHPSENNLIEVTLLNIMRQRYPSVIDIGNTNLSGVVHRLDRDTSGVMVFAKNRLAQNILKDQWKNRETLKIYHAVVKGCPTPNEGIIEAPIGKDPANTGKQAVVEDGLSAETSYEVIKNYNNKYSLLEVKIKTGRTHQIRVHLAAIGYPIIGDKLYGIPVDQIQRQALHSKMLGVKIPSTDEWKEFTSDLPQDMIELIEYLETNT